jgi:nucleotide-binding universal stress UspA family protein
MTRLLIGYDGSESARGAIGAAAGLFRGAEAVIAHVHPAPPPPETGALARIALPEPMIQEGLQRLREDIEANARTTVEDGVQHAAAAGLQATPCTAEAVSAWRTLRDLAEREAADLIVCGTRGQGAIDRFVVGSTASGLLHHADRPLLVVPEGEHPLDGPLLAGFDGSEGARAALRFAAEHLRGREVIVAHAWRSPVRRSLRGQALLASSVDVLEEYADGVDAAWRDVAVECAQEGAVFAGEHGLTAHALAPESGHGDWQTLLAAAQEAGAAAVVVGSRGRGAVASSVLGSVATGLVHAALLPVLVVRTA